MYRVTFVALLLIACSGCATVTKGSTQSVSVNAVQGAICTLSSPYVGNKVITAPATVVLEKGPENVAVLCKKACYHDGKGVIEYSVEPMTAGNILIGGIIGLGVDAVSGAINKYEPEVKIAMSPIKGCGGRPKVSSR